MNPVARSSGAGAPRWPAPPGRAQANVNQSQNHSIPSETNTSTPSRIRHRAINNVNRAISTQRATAASA
jgi:hypothetical protein